MALPTLNISFLTMQVDINPTPKQKQCFKVLLDDKTNVVVFGGAAGGGKSWLGCTWIVTLCLKYPGIRCLIGRTVLATLKTTTLNTLFEVLSMMQLKSGEHYTFNGQSNILTFSNKSEILFKDLEDRPGDANKDSLGSMECTAIFVDEASQISALTFAVLKSRIRYKLNEYNLIPKILLTMNPSNNWIKKDFYLPYVQETLATNISFIPSLAYDNPFLPASYIQMLSELPLAQKKRLLDGDWNYLDSSNSLFDFESISRSVYRQTPNPQDKSIITADVARFGDDRTVFIVWKGLCVVDIQIYRKYSTTQLFTEIQSLMKAHSVHPNNVIVDSDGIGGGLADLVRATNFVNNSKALHDQNFTNLKSQCYFKLADYFKEGKISLNSMDPSTVDDLTQELLAITIKDVDKDSKMGVASKDEMKRILGKSPDISDAIMMRMLPEIRTQKSTGRYAPIWTI